MKKKKSSWAVGMCPSIIIPVPMVSKSETPGKHFRNTVSSPSHRYSYFKGLEWRPRIYTFNNYPMLF